MTITTPTTITTMTITTPAEFDKLSYIGAITELEPASGAFGSIRPPTYAAKAGSNATSWVEKLAITDEMTIPSRDHKWADVLRDRDGCPRRARAVLVNSLGAEAHHLGQVLLHDSGVDWGRIAVNPPDSTAVKKVLDTVPADDTVRDVVRKMLETHGYDSWTASHRLADASIRYATDPATGAQVWKRDSGLRGDIQAVDPRRDADWLWTHAANALIFGFWLSITGNGVNPKWARALSSEVIGYGVSLLRSGATKGSDLGPVSNEFRTSTDAGGELRLGEKKKAVAVGEKPSAYGLGQIATSADYSAVSCEVILRRAGISLTHLREIKSASGNQQAIVRAAAAASMFALAAVSTRNLFLRSGTDLFPVSTVWTARTVDGRTVTLEVDVEQAKSVLKTAMADLSDAGLAQAEEIKLTMSPELVRLSTDCYVSAPKGDGGN
jgi:CRISPR-associated protein Csb1